MNRTTRSISLTSEGETYLAHATRILADLRDMEDVRIRAAAPTPRGLLKVNASLGFGRTTIAPLVSEFAQRYADVRGAAGSDRPRRWIWWKAVSIWRSVSASCRTRA